MKNVAQIGGLIGLGLVGLAVSGAGRGPSTSKREEDEATGSMGFAPPEPSQDQLKELAHRFHTLMHDDCTPGTFYPSSRGDILLGRGPKSITWRALFTVAQAGGADEDLSARLAADTARKVAYANLICACPYNTQHLTQNVGSNEFKTAFGYGIDLQERPILWMPIINESLFVEHGIVAPDTWEEDSTSTLEVPPELRDFHIDKD